MDVFWAAPPVSRTLTSLAAVESLLVHSLLLRGYYVVFLPGQLLKFPPELWRLVSPFLLTGGGISFLLDLYFIYLFGSSLETSLGRFSEPGAFLTYVVFVALFIMLTVGCLMGGMIFTGPLILAFAYTYAQEFQSRMMTFYVIRFPVKYLPWAMLLLTLVSGGWPAVLSEGMGILAAHLYEFLTHLYPLFGGGRNYLSTPGFIRRYFTTRPSFAGSGPYYRADYRQQQPSQPSSSRGWTSSLQNPWGGRGAGRRLGGGD